MASRARYQLMLDFYGNMPGGTLGRMPRRGRPPKGTAEPEYEPIQLTQRSSIPDGHLPVGCWCEARAADRPRRARERGPDRKLRPC